MSLHKHHEEPLGIRARYSQSEYLMTSGQHGPNSSGGCNKFLPPKWSVVKTDCKENISILSNVESNLCVLYAVRVRTIKVALSIYRIVCIGPGKRPEMIPVLGLLEF